MESYGTELLENRSLGLLKQIDFGLGNSDGWLDSAEVEQFASLVRSARNWTNSSSAGCCIFDYTPMQASEAIQITVMPPDVGPVNRTEGSWGWIESANMSGVSDGRVLRLIDLPRVGAIIEEIPVWIGLPEGWEFRFSPMSDIISGNPNIFVVDRSKAPVASDIRITLAENEPPRISSSKYPSSSTSSLDGTLSFSSTCTDSELDSPIIQWEVSSGDEVVLSHQNSWLEITPSLLGFSHGDLLSVNSSCTDFHGEVSYWNDNSVVDGIMPTWSGSIFSSQQTSFDTEQETIEVPSGTELEFHINGSDDSGLPVSLEMHTNISNGWRQTGTSQEMFHFTANQGFEVNGAHLGLYERHLSRNPTEISVLLLVIDDAGNSVTKNWTVRVLDANPPTVIPRLLSNDLEIDLDEAHEGDELVLDLSHSFDDLDDINNVIWSVWADGSSTSHELPDLLIFEANWTEAEFISLPMFPQGYHEVIVNSTDSKGNSVEEVIPIVILPKSGAHIRILEAYFSEEAEIGDTATLTVIYQNEGLDEAFVRVCLSEICGRWTEQKTSTSLESGPALGTVELQFEIIDDNIQNLSLQWDSNSAGTNGEIPILLSLPSDNEDSRKEIIVIIAALLVMTFAFFFTRPGD